MGKVKVPKISWLPPNISGMGVHIESIGTKAHQKFGKVALGVCRVPKMFRALIYRAHASCGHLCDSTAFLFAVAC